MAEAPLITFKAGRCEVEGRKITPAPTPGYLYLYNEEDLIHLCWRPRSSPADVPDVDLITIPGDASFHPLIRKEDQAADNVRSPTNGRIFVLKFSSSGEKHYFWMQAKTQHRSGDASWFSLRDQRLGQIVDLLLSGEDVDVEREVEDMRREDVDGDGDDGGDGDGGTNGDADMMELDRQLSQSETGGAGQDATGGDPREEGEASREGGADGGRAALSSSMAPQDTSTLVQNFLNSLGGSNSQQSQIQDTPYTTLTDLLPAGEITVPYIASLDPADPQIDILCSLLPPEIFLLAQEGAESATAAESSPAVVQAAIEALAPEQKKDVLRRVLRSPQLQQSLQSLTIALRDGGLPMIGDALGLQIENGGLIRGGSVPLGGGQAVAAFVEGVKKAATKRKDEKDANK